MNNSSTPIFDTEARLVDLFVRSLQDGRTAFGSLQITTEWDHRSGFVDVLVRDRKNNLIAFEAKLKDWKRAFFQAYRNTAYANRTYILLPRKEAEKAMRYREDFELRGIGLCSMDGEGLQVLIEATEQDVLLAWLRNRAHAFFDKVSNDDSRETCRSREAAMS